MWWHSIGTLALHNFKFADTVLSIRPTNQAAEHGWAHLTRQCPAIRTHLDFQAKYEILNVLSNAPILFDIAVLSHEPFCLELHTCPCLLYPNFEAAEVVGSTVMNTDSDEYRQRFDRSVGVLSNDTLSMSTGYVAHVACAWRVRV